MKVYQAINAVQAALSKKGITKDRTASGFGAGFQFRGIDDTYNALSPLLAEHGLVIMPRCVERHESQRASGAKTLYFVVVKMEFDFISSEDGSKHTACMFGEAMDSGDKATNKAMSIAYKYACFQAFAIPTEADNDPDATVHEPAPNAQQRTSNSKTNSQAGNKPKPQQQGNKTHPEKSADQVITDIKKATKVEVLAQIRDWVAARQYSDTDIQLIKGELKSRHDTIILAANAE